MRAQPSVKHTEIVSMQGIYLTIHNKTILDNISFDLERGKILTIVGPNGAGKSSLIKIMVGLVAHSAGTLYIQPKLRIGYTPQRLHLDPTLPLSVRRFLSLVPKVASSQIIEVLKQVGVLSVVDQSIHTLSGGELQRVLLARALLAKPDLLVLDEPAQGVDLSGQAELYRLILSIRDVYHCAVVLVSHDLSLVMAKTDEVICLNQHVCCSGCPEMVVKDPKFLDLFGLSATDFAFYMHRHDHDH